MMPEPIYFYTKHYPHQCSSGPSVHEFEEDFKPIKSIELAEELANHYAVGGFSQRRCVTTYGVMYAVNEQEWS